MLYTADFETTTDINDCRVWAWGICEIGNPSNFIYGNELDEFMWFHCGNKLENNTYYFHNLKFDGEFIFHWLYENGFEHVTDRKEFKDKTFTTLISDKGVFYSIEICFKKQGKKINKATLYCSLKVLNFSVDKIGKDFGLPVLKMEVGEEFYRRHRKVGHILTDEEINYLRNDVEVMARALEIMFNQDLTKMTIGSNALEEYKNIIGKQNFTKYFPKPDYDGEVRKSYKGGWTYLNPKFKDKEIKDGLVLDVNSLYPWVMFTKKLPYGKPIKYSGKYEHDELYPLYIQNITCMFEVKKDHLPSIQIKHDLDFKPTEYLTSSRDRNGIIKEVHLCLTSVDLELFFDQYEVYNIEYHGGYKFKSSDSLFKDYINKWIEVKIANNGENGNKSMRAIAKLMLNSLYGKFALNPIVRSKYPIYDKVKKKLHYVYGEEETREPLYIPVGTFITAYAREKTIRTAQTVFDRFIYADTDSLHLVGNELPNIEIDDDKLGAWAWEFTVIRGKYLRQKCYMEEGYEPKKPDNIFTNICCAGMPSRCYDNVTFENFKVGSKFEGKLQTTRVSGGIVLTDNYYTIKNTLI